MRETKVRESISLFFWSTVSISCTSACGPIARETEGVSDLSGESPDRKMTRVSVGTNHPQIDQLMSSSLRGASVLLLKAGHGSPAPRPSPNTS